MAARSNQPCIFAHLGGCEYRLTDHHVVPKQRIRKRHATLAAAFRRGMGPRPWSLRRALEDPRLKVRICWRHHEQIEQHILHLSAADLHPGLRSAAEEYGLTASLDHDFSRGKLVA